MTINQIAFSYETARTLSNAMETYLNKVNKILNSNESLSKADKEYYEEEKKIAEDLMFTASETMNKMR